MTTTAAPLLLGVETVAERLSVHPLTIRNLIKRGELTAVRVGRRVMVPSAAVAQFIADNIIAEPAAARKGHVAA